MDDRDVTDLKDRIEKIESREDKVLVLVNTLERAVDKISIILEQHQEQKIVDRLRQVELDMANEKIISKAVQWLGISIGGTAILLMASYLFGTFQ